ncbi:extracellular solute-binding protein [Pseudactinotalea sp. Z1748]|uniref:extracellular solute-binding protein n=1 Tax=Pseudactinotalea sp. Z1748 TaxID=3413027 RepID=UPI003C7D7621
MNARRLTGSIAGLLAFGLAISACGSGGTGEGGSTDTLRVWFPGNHAEEMALINDELVPIFEEEHDLNVEVEFIDWGDLAARLSTGFAGGTTPDVFGHGNAAAAGYAAEDRVIALDGYLEQLPEEEVADFTFLDQGVVDDEHIIMPLRGFGHLLAYRADLFEEAGLDPAAAPGDWAELRSAAEALTERDGQTITRAGIVMSTQDTTSMTQAYGNFLFQAGGAFLAEDNATVTWDSEEGVAALEFLVDLYVGEDAVASGLGEATTNAGAQHPLVTGRAAMAVLDEATLKTIHEQAPEVAEDIVVAAPIAEAQSAAFGGAGNGLFISADSSMQDEAWEFIQFLLEPENAKAYVETVGGIPARASLADDPELTEVPYIAPYMAAAEEFQGNPNVELWTQIRDVLGNEVEAALHGVTPPAEALNAAAAEANALLVDN